MFRRFILYTIVVNSMSSGALEALIFLYHTM